ncbi:MAG: hypothetical protein ACYDHM_10535 [Acidiferrobacterales bacterium]
MHDDLRRPYRPLTGLPRNAGSWGAASRPDDSAPSSIAWRARHGLSGWVRNRGGQAEILAQSAPAAIDAFAAAPLAEAPPLAQPALLLAEDATPASLPVFTILEARTDQTPPSTSRPITSPVMTAWVNVLPQNKMLVNFFWKICLHFS